MACVEDITEERDVVTKQTVVVGLRLLSACGHRLEIRPRMGPQLYETDVRLAFSSRPYDGNTEHYYVITIEEETRLLAFLNARAAEREASAKLRAGAGRNSLRSLFD